MGGHQLPTARLLAGPFRGDEQVLEGHHGALAHTAHARERHLCAALRRGGLEDGRGAYFLACGILEGLAGLGIVEAAAQLIGCPRQHVGVAHGVHQVDGALAHDGVRPLGRGKHGGDLGDDHRLRLVVDVCMHGKRATLAL